jgi:hypothetical protein
MLEYKHIVFIFNILILATPTDKVINKGLLRISKICDILNEKFQISLNEHRQKN